MVKAQVSNPHLKSLDAEVKVKQKQALDALSSIEEEFANLRDR